MDTNKSPSVKNLTTGSVGQKLLFFTLPYLLSYFLQTLYGLADLFLVGQFNGVAETTAVSIGSQVMQEQRFQLCGFSREIALIDYGITNDTEKFVTEICIPVRPAQADAL